MSFMQQEVRLGDWIVVKGDWDVHIYPADLFSTDWAKNEHPDSEVELVKDQYGARMSAPGYLDCTEWCLFETKQEAIDCLDEYFGDE